MFRKRRFLLLRRAAYTPRLKQAEEKTVVVEKESVIPDLQERVQADCDGPSLWATHQLIDEVRKAKQEGY